MTYRFAKEVLFDVASLLAKAGPIKYSEVLACDRTIREFGPTQVLEDSVNATMGFKCTESNVHLSFIKVIKDVGELLSF